MPSIDQILKARRAANARARQEAESAGRARIRAVEREQAAPTPPPPPPAPGGGVGPVPFSQTKAGLEQAHQTALKQLQIQQENQDALDRKRHRDSLALQAVEQDFLAGEAQKQRDRDAAIRREEIARKRTEDINRLKIERQSTFSQLIQSGDQVRAVLFALGVGPENDTFDVRARSLGITLNELRGARGLERTTEAALNRVLGRTTVDIGTEGVRGLGSAVGSARAFVQGGADIQTLLASAFGVGSLREGEQPGISRARLGELVTEVTPVGVL